MDPEVQQNTFAHALKAVEAIAALRRHPANPVQLPASRGQVLGRRPPRNQQGLPSGQGVGVTWSGWGAPSGGVPM
jgi:hypothetical protein